MDAHRHVISLGSETKMSCSGDIGSALSAKDSDTNTATRDDLPKESLFLLAEYPRPRWRMSDTHPIAMRWLEVHGWFRGILAAIVESGHEWRTARFDEDTFARTILIPSQILLDVLEGHHRNESTLYFPILAAADKRIARAVGILESDHKSLNSSLVELAVALRAMSRGIQNKVLTDTGLRVLALVEGLNVPLNRHFADEEDIVIPFLSLRGDPVFGPAVPTAR